MTIAVYLRVSTTDQNVESQRPQIQAWLERQYGAVPSVRWYEDQETGKSLKRPAFMKLARAVRGGEVDTVIVWKLDRLSRRMIDGVRLIGEWTERGVRIVSVTQNIDLSGMTGQLVAAVLFAVAEMELAHLKERQAAGIAVAKAQGKYKGRNAGATKGNPARARALKAKGLTEKEIAATMHISERSVFRYLKRA